MLMQRSSSRSKHKGKTFLVDVMSAREKRTFCIFVLVWLASLTYLWQWWLQNEHILSWSGITITSLLLAWQTILPAYYFYFVAKMKRANPAIPIPAEWRVAMVVTKAPSEPWPIVQKTLEAMLAQAYPHDTWLADEDPQPETLAWCEANGVKISSRKGIEAYHQATWPRRTKCKEGNLAYFYDNFGYAAYDFVAQLDADHVPEPGYLEAMLRPFVNPAVGYVAAPSICDANAEESWVVNARAYVEASLHGSLQAGYNDGWAPLCIGSHYAVRTAALKQIGGLGPELAEDHSTTLMMNAGGWSGVFAFDAEAHGDGPTCFTHFLVQEFQWARSLTTILLSMTPRYIGRLKPHLQFQFLFAQLWYPFYSLSLFVGVLLPIIALLRDEPWVDASYLGFVGRSFLVTLTCIACVNWISSHGWFRPKNARVVSWETVLFQVVRWPWVLAGVSNAVIAWALRKELSFKVTPKGINGTKPLPLSVLLPYLVLGIGSAAAVIFINEVNYAPGYYFLTLINASFYVAVSVAIIWAHRRENGPAAARALRRPQASIVLALSVLVAAFGIRTQDAVNGVVATKDKSPARLVLTSKQ